MAFIGVPGRQIPKSRALGVFFYCCAAAVLVAFMVIPSHVALHCTRKEQRTVECVIEKTGLLTSQRETLVDVRGTRVETIRTKKGERDRLILQTASGERALPGDFYLADEDLRRFERAVNSISNSSVAELREEAKDPQRVFWWAFAVVFALIFFFMGREAMP